MSEWVTTPILYRFALNTSQQKQWTDMQEGWISSSKQLTYNTLTTIKNVKRDPITFILRISLPISEEKNITVQSQAAQL